MDLIVKHFNELSTTELYEILKTRFEIFVTEQECIYQDLDDKDQDAIHVFCYNDSGRVAGCLRVFWKDHDEASGIAQIGRVVTLEHGKGIGGQILHEGVRVATERLKAKKIYLEAQEYAIGYYAKEGFEVVSEPFMEDGIPHVKMERQMEAFKVLNGTVEIYPCCDTLQVADYSKFNMAGFSEEHKKEMRKKQFPADLDMAFQMGARLSK